MEDSLSRQKDMVFAYLFGSFMNRDKYRDIDIGIYMDPYPELIHFGRIQTELDDRLKPRVDLVLLNDIPDKNPALGYELLTGGILLLNRNPVLHTAFKSKVFRYYFDTAYLRDTIGKALIRRLESNKFGMRNYE